MPNEQMIKEIARAINALLNASGCLHALPETQESNTLKRIKDACAHAGTLWAAHFSNLVFSATDAGRAVCPHRHTNGLDELALQVDAVSAALKAAHSHLPQSEPILLPLQDVHSVFLAYKRDLKLLEEASARQPEYALRIVSSFLDAVMEND